MLKKVLRIGISEKGLVAVCHVGRYEITGIRLFARDLYFVLDRDSAHDLNTRND